jgi:hypothetical protein
MSQRHLGRMCSRREWLCITGLGASIAVLPAAPNGNAVLGKEGSMHDIMHLIKIHAPSERVYEAITTAEGIRQWWTRDAAIESKVGAVGEFGFSARRFVAQVTVEELDPNYSCALEGSQLGMAGQRDCVRSEGQGPRYDPPLRPSWFPACRSGICERHDALGFLSP